MKTMKKGWENRSHLFSTSPPPKKERKETEFIFKKKPKEKKRKRGKKTFQETKKPKRKKNGKK